MKARAIEKLVWVQILVLPIISCLVLAEKSFLMVWFYVLFCFVLLYGFVFEFGSHYVVLAVQQLYSGQAALWDPLASAFKS